MSDTTFGTFMIGVGLGQILGSDGHGFKVFIGAIVGLVGILFLFLEGFKEGLNKRDKK